MYVEDVEDGKRTYMYVEDVKDIKTNHNRFLTDFLEFIPLLSEMSKMCTNYNVTLDLL